MMMGSRKGTREVETVKNIQLLTNASTEEMKKLFSDAAMKTLKRE